jgi:hypothetical protein
MMRYCLLLALLFLFALLPYSVLLASDEWQAEVFGADWQSLASDFRTAVPELASGTELASNAGDTLFWLKMPESGRQNIIAAVAAYYQALDRVVKGAYADRRFEVAAAREINGYVLLWIDEPGVFDGGRTAVYSIELRRIVGEFAGGGFRG